MIFLLFMTCRYEKDGLKMKKIQKISKIWIRKILASDSSSLQQL